MNKMNVIAEQKPIISIIVPVYNAEQYLASCLNSLLAQSFDNIEILCINDGSKDNSLEILKTYKKINHKIRVFSQENSGPAKARNVGLENAQGEFIMFCDADDTYEPNMCEEMYRTISDKNVDVVMCNTQGYNRNGKKVSSGYYFPFVEGRHFLSQALKYKINVYLWNKIFRKTTIDFYQLKFPEGHKSDDNCFVYSYLMCADSVYFLDKKLYSHFDRENSIMDLYRSDKIQYSDIKDKVDIMEMVYHNMLKYNTTEKNMESFCKIFCNEILYAWVNVPKIWEEKFLTRIQEILQIIPDTYKNFDIRFSILFAKITENNFYAATNLLDLLLKDIKKERRKYVMQESLEPAFNENNITIVFNCDNNFAKYLSVTIQSIIENSTLEKNYDIIILNQDISVQNCELLRQQIVHLSNFSIRFYNMDAYIQKYQVSTWFTQGHIKSAAYYRLFVFDLLKKYKKVIYLDADLVVNTDISKLYEINMDSETYCLAVKDSYISLLTPEEELAFPDICQYAKDVLKMDNLKNYFNSGVMLLDIEKINNNYTLEDFIIVAKRNNKYFHDQNVLNSLFYNHVKLIEPSWNVQLNSGYAFIEYGSPFINDINIFHFCSKYKPWLVIKKTYSYIWWQYAQKSPFYFEILGVYMCKIVADIQNNGDFSNVQYQNMNLIKLIICYKSSKLKYLRYKILSKITFGKMREHYKRKKRELKMRLKEVKKILNSK